MFYQIIEEIGDSSELKPIMTYLGLYLIACLFGLLQGFGKYVDAKFDEPKRINEMILILKNGIYDNNNDRYSLH